MDNLDRRNFLGITTAAAAFLGSRVDAADQGDVARSRSVPLEDAGADRDPLGLHGAANLTAESVRRAIERGVQYLNTQQLPNGTWPNFKHYDGGLTPLCTLALLHSGCALNNVAMSLALKYLRSYTPGSTYTASLQTMVFCLADPKEDRALIERNVAWLESKQIQEGDQRGMWSLPALGSTDHTDNSMTHFAMLALHEAERVGVHANQRTWTIALQHWQDTQNADGSYGWGANYPGTGSMTCAGIAALIIAGGTLNAGDAQVNGNQVIGCARQTPEPHFEAAMSWLQQHFSVHRNPGTEFWTSYYLYALERAGRMTARRFIGEHDWYREGAQMLVQSQQYSGAWPNDLEFQNVADKNVSTSFSLMFLAKGRWPVVVAHLKRSPSDDWNRHRAALANLIGHVEQAWGRNLTHQVVDIERASVDELLQSPVVFINGRETPRFSAEEMAKLRSYVDRGGFIFAEQCCGGTDFDNGFRRLMWEAFPEPEQQLRLLPPDHPVWAVEHAIRPEVPLWGIDTGCRTSVIYCPFDVSCYWELDGPRQDRPELAGVQASLTAARQIGVNVLSYATGREVAFKNPALLVAATTKDDGRFERGTLYVANVLHPGGCHAAPAALRNLLRRASEDFRLRVNAEPREVPLSDSDLAHYHVLFFHGRNSFELTAAERENLRAYVERGGTVIADAVCSSTKFAESFRREMKAVFPSRSLQSIPASDPLFTPAFGGADVTTVSRRTPKAVVQIGQPATETIRVEPTLEGVEIEGRFGVLFSPYDISCALETEPLGCSGYVRKDAFLIAMNALLYSLNQ